MPADAPAPRPHRRRLGRLLAALLLLHFLLLGGAYLALPWIAGAIARDQLAAAGFTPVSLDVTAIGLSEARIVDLRLGPGPDLTVAAVLLRYHPAGLLEGVIDGITVVNSHLRGRLDRDGLSIPLLDLLASGEGGGEAPSLPGNGIVFQGAVVELETPSGLIRAGFDGTLVAEADGGLRFVGPVEVAAAEGRLAGTVSATLSPGSGYQALLHITEGDAVLGDFLATGASGQVIVSGAGAELRWAGAHLRFGAVGQGAGQSAPAGLRLRYDGAGASLDLALGSPGTAGGTGIAGRLGLAVTDVRAEPLAFELDGWADGGFLSRLVPGLGANATGRVGWAFAGAAPSEALSGLAMGQAALARAALSGRLDLDLAGLEIPGLGGALALSGSVEARLADGWLELTPVDGLRAAADGTVFDEIVGAAPAVLLVHGPDGGGAGLALAHDGEAVRLRGDLTVASVGEAAAGARLALAGEASIDPATGAITRFTIAKATASAPTFDLDGLRLELRGLTLSGTGTADDANIDFTLDAVADGEPAPGVRLREAALTLAGTVVREGPEVTVRGKEGGRLVAAGIGAAGARTTDGVEIAISPGDEPLFAGSLGGPEGATGRVALHLALAEAVLAIGSGDGAPLAVAAAVPDLRLTLSLPDRALAATVADGHFRLPAEEIVLDHVAGDLHATLDAEAPLEVSIRGARLSHTATPAFFAPLYLSGTASGPPGALAFDLRATGLVGVPDARLTGALDGAGGGHAEVSLDAIVFAPDGRQPRQLFPVFGYTVNEVGGVLDASGTFDWGAGSPPAAIDVLLEDISFVMPPGKVERFNGVVRLDGLVPLSTPPGQQLAAALVDIGMPLTEGVAKVQLRPDGQVHIEEATWRLAKGRLTIADVTLDPLDPHGTFDIGVEGLDISAIANFASIEGLNGSGLLGGTIPVVLDDTGVVVRGGRLESRGPGFIWYKPKELPAMLRDGGEGVSVVFTIIQNFRSEKLVIELEGRPEEDMTVVSKIMGGNPDYLGGHSVDLNLTLSGPLASVGRIPMSIYDLPDQIRDSIEEFHHDE